MTDRTTMDNTDTVSKQQLEGKGIEEWTEAEKEAAQEMGHSVQLSYLTVRQLAQTGSKTQTWDEMVQGLLEGEGVPA